MIPKGKAPRNQKGSFLRIAGTDMNGTRKIHTSGLQAKIRAIGNARLVGEQETNGGKDMSFPHNLPERA
jgi:hypothetical protein